MLTPSRPAARHPSAHASSAVLLGCLALAFDGSGAAHAQRVQRGLAFAPANCATCHSLDRYTPSPLRVAPPFADLHKRYPVESREEALAEGIVTGHPTMPEFNSTLVRWLTSSPV
jgi:mono/diheme cytochrome c family protein